MDTSQCVSARCTTVDVNTSYLSFSRLVNDRSIVENNQGTREDKRQARTEPRPEKLIEKLDEPTAVPIWSRTNNTKHQLHTPRIISSRPVSRMYSKCHSMLAVMDIVTSMGVPVCHPAGPCRGTLKPFPEEPPASRELGIDDNSSGTPRPV